MLKRYYTLKIPEITMDNISVNMKLRVFISSLCDDKYINIRDAIKSKLLRTNLVECYCFEKEAPSSKPIPEAYLDIISICQVFLLIVDNKDGLRNPIMLEYKRAKECHLNILAFFCDEFSKEKTEIQKEIENEQVCKYKTVSKFNDIVDEACNAIFQDMINVYGTRIWIPKPETNVDRIYGELNKNTYVVPKQVFHDLGHTKEAIYTSIFNVNSDENVKTGKTDELFNEFLQVVLYNKPFNIDLYYELAANILDRHEGSIKEVIKRRLEAMKLYYLGDINKCIEILQVMTKDIESDENIPKWIVNDIAIDLRNMININDTKKNIFSYINPGQEIINESKESLYYPLIDRVEKNIKSEIIKVYSSVNYESPYTRSFGGLKIIFTEMATYYCVAMMYGSITHLKEVPNKMSEIFEALVSKYNNYIFKEQMIKYLILNRNDKKLQDYIRTYNSPYEITNAKELEKIIENIGNISNQIEFQIASMLLLKYFGYYLSEKQFEAEFDRFHKFALNWIKNKNRVLNLRDTIIDVYSNCTRRIKQSKIVDFILLLFEKKGYLFLTKAFELIRHVNIKELSEMYQEKLAEKILDIIEDKEKRASIINFDYTIILFCKFATINVTKIEEILKSEMPDLYEDYYLEKYASDKAQSMVYIKKYLDVIKLREEKLKNGTKIIFDGNNQLEIIYNIINLNKLNLSEAELLSIADVAKDMLLIDNATLEEKKQAIDLLTLLWIVASNKECLTNILEEIKSNQHIIVNNRGTDFLANISVLALSFRMKFLLYFKYENMSDELISLLANIHNMSDIDIIESLKYIYNILNICDQNNINEGILLSILHLAISLCEHKERDVRWFAVNCMIELTKSKYNKIALNELSNLMGNGTVEIKIAIISSIKKMRGDSSIKDYIIKKATLDNNFLVRDNANSI